MNGVLGVARADFFERQRRFSFIAMTAMSLFAAFWFVPRDDGSMQVMAIQPDRIIQADNPSWIPIASAWGLGFFLPLIGFFYLRNAVAFDEKSGVSQLISTSPVGNIRYMLGKLCSGTLLLYCFTAVVIIGSLFMTIWHFPNQHLSAYDFLSPFIFLLTALPFCASLAVLFESVRFLRGAIGSILYVVGFFTLYVLIIQTETPSLLLRVFDFSGTAVIFHGIGNAVLEQSGQPMDNILFLGSAGDSLIGAAVPTAQLVFHGIRHTAADIQGFAGMLCVTLGLTLLSAPLYKLSENLSQIKMPKKRRVKKADAPGIPPQKIYAPIQSSGKFSALRGITAELRLLLYGQPLLWKAVGLVGFALCLFIDLGVVQTYIMPLLMIWFINVFSAMGSREYQYDMLKIITTAPDGRLRQIVNLWLSGIFIALAISIPVILRMLFAGQIDGILACLAGVIFLPSFAMFLGEFTKTQKVFETAFIVITYIVLNNAAALMYMGIHPDVVSLSRSSLYLAVGVIMGIAAVLQRARRAL